MTSSNGPLRARITGTGAWAPPRVVTNEEMGKIVETNDEWIVKRTGIKTRRLVAFEGEYTTADMAEKAARQALEAAGVDPLELDMIIVGTVTPDYRCPSCAVIVQDKLGAKNAAAFDVGAACAGSMFALSVAEKFIRSGAAKKILVIGGETLSTITNWQDRNTCVLFGDAAGALILEAGPADGPGVLDTRIYSDGATWQHIYIPAGGSKKPATPQDIAERQDRLVMNGREVYKFAVRALVDASKAIVEKNGLTIKDVNLVVAHQANLRIIEAVGERLDVPLSQFVINIDRYGNTSSASAFVTFDEARREGRMKAGDLVLMLAIGAGMCWSSALYRV
ncbi:MAG: beta-ketoacyl-ACP synthase III [Deltaproteobacteria bacterium]|nr:beta-ketoacyl-ACP synthase III [Deltaproteobacteria bacterium]